MLPLGSLCRCHPANYYLPICYWVFIASPCQQSQLKDHYPFLWMREGAFSEDVWGLCEELLFLNTFLLGRTVWGNHYKVGRIVFFSFSLFAQKKGDQRHTISFYTSFFQLPRDKLNSKDILWTLDWFSAIWTDASRTKKKTWPNEFLIYNSNGCREPSVISSVGYTMPGITVLSQCLRVHN